MFDQLGGKIQQTFKKLSGKGKLSEKDIDEALKEIRMALLEADVNYKVVKSFLSDVRQKALDEDVLKSLTPAQQVIKTVNEEMRSLLGGSTKDISISSKMPSVLLLAGVQGSGKTTSAAKLSRYIKEKNKNVMLAACDIKRAAAVEQLSSLAKQEDIFVYTAEGKTPLTVAKEAVAYASKNGYEVLIVDTAGRQHVDDELMDEIGSIAKVVKPDEVLFVVDCMMGQQAVDSCMAFNEKLDITGFILTKADSDARGGAALSVSFMTGKPIKFTGTGEKLSDFEVFHPDRVASRILGMGDMLTLIEKAQKLTDNEKNAKLSGKILKNSLSLEDYLEQIDNMNKMGGINQMLSSMPNAGKLSNMNIDEKQILRTKAIIQSMTPKERNSPKILNASRRRRIAKGSGTTVTDVNRLINGFEQTKKLMKQFSGNKRKFNKNLPFM